MDKLESLLKEVSKIVVKEKTQQEEKRKRGENFNIFNVLGLSTSEVRLHSAFLAELLNPNGDHGLGSKFLEAFVNDVVSDDNKFPFECNSAMVSVELDIGPIRNDETEGGRIDIYIQDMNKQTIVIENKIYAGDQSKQMLRYYNYVTKNEHLEFEKNQFRLLYLTLDDHSPSQDSTGGDEKVESSIKCINYKDHILKWLERCIEISALYPAIREIISQYVINIKQIMNIMSEENKKELVGLLSNNMSAAVSILEVESDIRKIVRRNYINTVLRTIAERRGFSLNSEIDAFVNLEGNSFLSFIYKEFESLGSLVLRLDPYRGYLWLYCGVMTANKQYKDVKGEKVWPRELEGFPYGYDYLSNCYWDRNSTIIQMQKEIEMKKEDYEEKATIAMEIDKQLKMVLEKELFEKLAKMCSGI